MHEAYPDLSAAVGAVLAVAGRADEMGFWRRKSVRRWVRALAGAGVAEGCAVGAGAEGDGSPVVRADEVVAPAA